MKQRFKDQVGDAYDRAIAENTTIKKWKNREQIYLWVVTCKDDECDGDSWQMRMDWCKYTKHYKDKHKSISDWTGNKNANKVDSIMDHVRVVSQWRCFDDSEPKKKFKEYRFVDKSTLLLIPEHEENMSINSMNESNENESESNENESESNDNSVILVSRSSLQERFKYQVSDAYDHAVLVDGRQIKEWKNREEIYLWNVTCEEKQCDRDEWDMRMDWLQYTRHYNTIHKSVHNWTAGKAANKVDTIMDHVRIVSQWRFFAINESNQKRKYKEYRFVETSNLSWIHFDDDSSDDNSNDDNSSDEDMDQDIDMDNNNENLILVRNEMPNNSKFR